MKPTTIERKLKAARELLSAEAFPAACRRFEQLTHLCPESALIWLEYGAAATACRQAEKAEWARNKVRDLARGDAKILLQLGHQYHGARQPDQARDCYLAAAAANPQDGNPLISLAVLLEKNHQLEEARDFVNRCLARDPADEQARYFAALLDRRENQLESAERRLRDLIAAEPRHPYVCYACRYELAHVLDQTGRADEAMVALAEAKALVRRLGDVDEILRVYDGMAVRSRQVQQQPTGILREWAKIFPPQARQPGVRLAFLGGHPRSGTTLIEQILGVHPEVAAVDEPHLFSTVLLPALEHGRAPSATRLNAVRRRYISALEQESGSSVTGKLLLEKNPSLTSALPLWLRVFPELRVLVALRDPRDVVISCYFQNLPLNVANANFLTLERTARHYAALMDVWLAVRQWEGFAWLETRYEETIADLLKEGRRVTEFLGLGWHEEQGRFYEHRGRIYSPSYHDVTRPIHARSVARWRAYEKHLASILPVLEPYCRALGYT